MKAISEWRVIVSLAAVRIGDRGTRETFGVAALDPAFVAARMIQSRNA